MVKETWWDWRDEHHPAMEEELGKLSEAERKVNLEKLAARCVILDNLAIQTKADTVKVALGQFGIVVGVKMVRNPADNKFFGAAIAEMSTKEQREQVVRELKEYLFMVGAMPRPARAIRATPLLMLDHPWRRNPNLIKPRLVSRADPSATYLEQRELKDRLKVDDDEALLALMEEEEMKLASVQETACQEAMEKLRMIAKEQKAGVIGELRKLHGLNTQRGGNPFE